MGKDEFYFFTRVGPGFNIRIRRWFTEIDIEGDSMTEKNHSRRVQS
jgi:hypothetical protein